MSPSQPIPLNIVGPAYAARTQLQNNQKCINMFVEIDGKGSKEPACLLQTPGSTLFSALATTGKCRGGLVTQNDLMFMVCDTTLYEIDSAGAKAARGTIAGTAQVSMAENGIGFYEIMITTNSSDAYIFNYSTSTLTKITDPAFTSAGTVIFIDGYFLWNEPNTQKVWRSGLFDGLTFDGTWFKSAESDMDNLVSIATANRIIYLFGTKTTEIWTNQDLDTFPFGRQPGGLFQTGSGAIWSMASFDTRVFWLADDLEVLMTDGYQSAKISTPAIDYAISTYTQTANAVGFTYKMAGHEFYVLTFPGPDVTWVYDVSTGEWHQWSSYAQGRCRANVALQWGEKVYVGDWSSGDVSLLSYEVFTENDQPIIRERVTQVIKNEPLQYTMSRLVLTIDTGLTKILSGDGSDPKIRMSYSDDGGRTWSRDIERSMGKQGEYNKRIIWTRLGTFRDRLLRFRTSEPVKFAIISAYAEMEAGIW